MDRNWLGVELAGERALARSECGVTMAFGLGPATISDPPEERCRRILEAGDPPLRALRWAHQVHGRAVASITEEPRRPLTESRCVGRCDGLMTAEPDVAVLVWTADCVPILLAGGGVVAAVHSGWRGTAQDIVAAVVRRFETEHGVPASGLRAAIGPAISGPRYEVGPEVVEALSVIGIARDRWLRGRQVDLRALIEERLLQLGLTRNRVACVGPCTASTSYLASYRRDGASAGRQFAVIYRTEGAAVRRPRS